MSRSQSATSSTASLGSIEPVRKARGGGDTGIEVQEEELGLIEAQLMYRMRCECGRPWFDVRLPKVAECPGCGKKGMVFV